MTEPKPFQVMIKPSGPRCNLACQYCYYLPKADLFPGSHLKMPDDLLEEFTRQYATSQPVPEVTFSWQGGEPTQMGLDFFRRAVALQKRYCPPEVRVLNTLQTNGTLLDEEWCRFLREDDFLVGLSVDGPRQYHDRYRRDGYGRGSFDRVMRGLSHLRTHEVETNVLACVSAANVGHPLDVYRFLRDEADLRFMQFIPIVERARGRGAREKVTQQSVTGRQYGEFLIAIFDEWVRRDVGSVFVQIFDVALAAWAGQRPGLCIFEETCGSAPILEHNGDLYACDHFVDPTHRIGNIRQDSLLSLMSAGQQRAFGQAKRDSLPSTCRQCDVYFVCHGGCPKNRISQADLEEGGRNWLCEGYQAFFRHARGPMEVMAGELRAGRPPAGVMVQLAQTERALQGAFARAHRNAPCPCGSGRKFKQCHGRPVADRSTGRER